MRSKENVQGRKLKLNKKFKPLPIGDDDEFYANGIFEFNVTRILAFIEANLDRFPVEMVEIELLLNCPPKGLSEKTIQTANVSAPVILAEISPGRFNVIDGNHRIERARREGLDKIPARRLSAEQHLAFLTSVRAYETYVDYWNSKIDDLR